MIDVKDLRYAWPGERGRETLKGLTFSIGAGRIFGFLGPSGAGKSTTQKVLIGLARGYSGSAKVGGAEAKTADAAYREKIGVAFEFPNFYQKLTGLENLEYFGSLYRTPKDDPELLMKRLGILDAARKPVAAYSKGMRMRLNLARALLHRPSILFLDEPTSGLDPANARIVKDLILERKEAGAAVFLTTHVMETADELCDSVAFLSDGAIAAMGAPGDLKLRYGKSAVAVEYERDGVLDRKSFPLDELGDNEDFRAAISEKGLRTIHTEEATLDRVFMAATGRKLE
ncbi:MAG: ABC transporter ATP-binding protein [Treponemataceae bacterium]